jgi:hypothetical protein
LSTNEFGEAMEKYKSETVQELAETLKTLSKGGKLTGQTAEMNEFLSILRLLKTYKLRHATDAHAFCRGGGLQVLLDLLSQCEFSGRDMVIVLGTVGNLCALDQNSRNIVSYALLFFSVCMWGVNSVKLRLGCTLRRG